MAALSHLRVVDLTKGAGYPGGYASIIFAELGAEVIKVESPGRGDPVRANYSGTPGPAAAHVGLNHAKRSITLDTRSAEGAGVLLELLDTADVVIDTGRPGAEVAPGVSYEVVAARNPGIVWAQLTGFGQDGPSATRPGHDLTYLASSGLLASLAPEGGFLPDLMLSVPMGALVCAVSVLAALEHRRETGRGARIDTAIEEAAMFPLFGAPGILSGNVFSIPMTPDRRTYRCADGASISLAAAEPRTWGALCEGLGMPELLDALHDPERAAEATERLEATFASAPAAHWVELLGPLGAAIGPVNAGADIAADPHHRARSSTVAVGGQVLPASPFRLYDAGGAALSPTRVEDPPELGADTDEVLGGLGIEPARLAELRAAGTI
jgi:alpha-methylacyl-CoA racemase